MFAAHGGLGNHCLERGALLHMEPVPQVLGDGARIMRPTAIGTPSAAQVDGAHVLVDLQDRQLATMRSCAIASDVDRILRGGVVAAKLRDRYANATGYPLGHYAPWSPRTSDFTRRFVLTATWALESGMVFQMYVSALGSRSANRARDRRMYRAPREDGARTVRALNGLRPAILRAVDRVRTGEVG